MFSYSTLQNTIKFHLFHKKDQTENPFKIKLTSDKHQKSASPTEVDLTCQSDENRAHFLSSSYVHHSPRLCHKL